MALTYLTNAVDNTAKAVYTFAAQPLGAAAAGRNILILGISRVSVAPASVTVTVGGVPATVVDLQLGADTVAWAAVSANTSATSADVVVDYGVSQARSMVSLWSSSTPLQLASSAIARQFGMTATTLTLASLPAGVVVAAQHMGSASTNTATWASATERFDVGGTNYAYSGADGSLSPTVTLATAPSFTVAHAVALVTPPPAIAATVDGTYNRVGVTLSGFTVDGPVTVERVVAATGSRASMRAVSAVSGGVGFGWDYEAPFGTAIRYEAYSGATLIASAEVTITSTSAMLRSPGLPALDVVVEVVEAPGSSRDRPRVILRPLGRRSALVLSDTAKSAEFGLTLRTYGFQAADSLIALFEGTPTALLIMPGAREAHRYVSLGGLVERPVVDYKAKDGTDLNDPGAMAEWSLDCVVTDSPVGGLYGDPTSSYEVLITTRATYGAVVTAKPTYLELLKGA